MKLNSLFTYCFDHIPIWWSKLSVLGLNDLVPLGMIFKINLPWLLWLCSCQDHWILMYQDKIIVWGATYQMSQGNSENATYDCKLQIIFILVLKHDYMSRTPVISKLQETICMTVHETSNRLLTNLEVGSYSFTNFPQVNPVIAGNRKAILLVINSITAFYNHILIVEECWKLRSSLVYLIRMSSKTFLLFTTKC